MRWHAQQKPGFLERHRGDLSRFCVCWNSMWQDHLPMGLRWIGLGRYCSLNWDNHSGEQPQAPQATTPSNDLALTGCQNQAVSASGLATLHTPTGCLPACLRLSGMVPNLNNNNEGITILFFAGVPLPRIPILWMKRLNSKARTREPR